MEATKVAQAPTHSVDFVEPVVKDKHNDGVTEMTLIETLDDNDAELNNAAGNVKTSESELVPADVVVVPSKCKPRDTYTVVAEPPISPHTGYSSAGRAEVVTPAGTVEAPPTANDTPSTETEAEKENVAPVKKASEIETVASAVEHEPQKAEHHTDPTVQHKVEQRIEQSVAPKAEQHNADPPSEAKSDTTATAITTTEPVPLIDSAPSTIKKQASNDSFASEEVLGEVQKFLTLQIVENRCSSHTKEIHEFMEKHLNEQQQKRYVTLLVESIVQHCTQMATAKGEEVSIDIQSNICLIEQMFLTLGRRSPLEDMYTSEEEEMLDLLFRSNSSDDLLIELNPTHSFR